MKIIKSGLLYCDQYGNIYEYNYTMARYSKKEEFNYNHLYAHNLYTHSCLHCGHSITVSITEKDFKSLVKIGNI